MNKVFSKEINYSLEQAKKKDHHKPRCAKNKIKKYFLHSKTNTPPPFQKVHYPNFFPGS